MKSILKKVAGALLVLPLLAVGVGFFNVTPASADCDVNGGLGSALTADCASGNGQPTNLMGSGGIITTIINVLLFIVGILCVVMIVFGGIRYTTSAGNKQAVDGAKNTIIYAVVGLIVAIVAYALVNWVFNAVGSK
jgi:hypothetical protein